MREHSRESTPGGVPLDPPETNVRQPRPTERDALPEETCSCGRPAVVVFFTEKFGEVPWCGENNV